MPTIAYLSRNSLMPAAPDREGPQANVDALNSTACRHVPSSLRGSALSIWFDNVHHRHTSSGREYENAPLPYLKRNKSRAAAQAVRRPSQGGRPLTYVALTALGAFDCLCGASAADAVCTGSPSKSLSELQITT